MIYEICNENKLAYLESQGTFVSIDTQRSALKMKEALAQHGVDIRTLEAEDYEAWICVGTATLNELRLFKKSLPEALRLIPKKV